MPDPLTYTTGGNVRPRAAYTLPRTPGYVSPMVTHAHTTGGNTYLARPQQHNRMNRKRLLAAIAAHTFPLGGLLAIAALGTAILLTTVSAFTAAAPLAPACFTLGIICLAVFIISACALPFLDN